MRMSNGDILAWQLTHLIARDVCPNELDLFDQIVDDHYAVHKPGEYSPVAFGGGEIIAMVASVFAVVLPALQTIAPKLFDAALDIGKEILKEKLKEKPDSIISASLASSLDVLKISELIVNAARAHRLSPSTADAVANAVLAKLVQAQGRSGA